MYADDALIPIYSSLNVFSVGGGGGVMRSSGPDLGSLHCVQIRNEGIAANELDSELHPDSAEHLVVLLIESDQRFFVIVFGHLYRITVFFSCCSPTLTKSTSPTKSGKSTTKFQRFSSEFFGKEIKLKKLLEKSNINTKFPPVPH